MQAIKTKIDAIKDEQLTDDEEGDRIDKLIAHCIATQESEQQLEPAARPTQTPAAEVEAAGEGPGPGQRRGPPVLQRRVADAKRAPVNP